MSDVENLIEGTSKDNPLHNEYFFANHRYSKLQRKFTRAQSMADRLGIDVKSVSKLKEKLDDAYDKKVDCLLRIRDNDQ